MRQVTCMAIGHQQQCTVDSEAAALGASLLTWRSVTEQHAESTMGSDITSLWSLSRSSPRTPAKGLRACEVASPETNRNHAEDVGDNCAPFAVGSCRQVQVITKQSFPGVRFQICVTWTIVPADQKMHILPSRRHQTALNLACWGLGSSDVCTALSLEACRKGTNFVTHISTVNMRSRNVVQVVSIVETYMVRVFEDLVVICLR